MNNIDSLELKRLGAHTNTKLFRIKIMENDTTQAELAEEYGVSKQTFSAWVTGRITPPLNTGLWIAARLGCKVEDLWTHKEE